MKGDQCCYRLGNARAAGRRQLPCNRVNTYPAHLPQLGQHHDDGGVVLPQHPPEILGGLCQWPLSGNVCFLLSASKHRPHARR